MASNACTREISLDSIVYTILCRSSVGGKENSSSVEQLLGCEANFVPGDLSNTTMSSLVVIRTSCMYLLPVSYATIPYAQ